MESPDTGPKGRSPLIEDVSAHSPLKNRHPGFISVVVGNHGPMLGGQLQKESISLD